MAMTPALRKFALTAHITISLGWMGAVASFLALAIAGLISVEPRLVRAAYLAMDLIAWFLILPLCLAALATGLLQSLGTRWGLLQHYWTLVKLMLTAGATLLLFMHMTPITHMSARAAATDLAPGDDYGLRLQLISDAALALLVLLATATLGVYKPWGRTRYSLRRANAAPRDVARVARAKWPWGSIAVLGLVGLVILAAANHLLGGGHRH